MNVAEIDKDDVGGGGNCKDEMFGRSLSKNLNKSKCLAKL